MCIKSELRIIYRIVTNGLQKLQLESCIDLLLMNI